mmetsp:Transcript_64440/g.179241  ORF Transcript_64440/g.179241 Transcript_64440/m.179241 type:complete len:314 (-) Transcript_64440:113-1054(-)
MALSSDDEAVLAAALPTVPQLAAYARQDLTISRLGGLTNIVFRVAPPGGAAPLCLRCPGADTEAYIDRTAERGNATAAAKTGVGPEVFHFGDNGVMLMPLLAGETMTPAAFASTPGAATRAGAALKKLHASGESFASKFEIFEQIDKYLAELGSEAQLPDGYDQALKAAESVRAALSARPLPTAPCHCDPLCENFIDDGDVMHIVDFEYGGMNDPLWDVGDLAVEAGLNESQQRELFAAYFGAESPPTAAEVGRVVLYKAMCDLLWTLWGLLQHKNGNPAEDFWAYSLERFARCKALMSTPEFGEHVAAVSVG